MKKFFFLLLLLTSHLFLLSNSSFTVWPEMILYPYFTNHGFMLFKDIVNPYFPLLTLILSQVFNFIGISIISLKIITYFLIFFSDILVFLCALRLSGKSIKAFLALISYIFLQFSLGGNGLWFELSAVPFLVYSIVTVFIDSSSKKQLFMSGFALSLAVLIKQNSLLFYLPVLVLFIGRGQIKKFVYFLLPLCILLTLTFLFLKFSGTFKDFFQWALILPLNYTSQPGFIFLPSKKTYILFLFLLIPAIAAFFTKYRLFEKFYWLFTFLISLSFAFPRYENFHLQILVAFGGILSSLIPGKKAFTYLFLTLLIFTISIPKVWNKSDRFIDQNTLSLAEKIKTFDSVYLLNSPDLAYFFAGKLPSKPWAINFPWYFEQPGFQDRFIDSFSKQKVGYVVVGRRLGGGKYDLGNYLPEKVMDNIYKNYSIMESQADFTIWKLKNE